MAIFALSVTSGVWADLTGTECDVQLGPDWQCRNVSVEGPEFALCGSCTQDPVNGCCDYTYRVVALAPPTVSHFDIIVERDIADKIVKVYYTDSAGDHDLDWTVKDDGSGDASAPKVGFGKFLQAYVTVQITIPTGIEDISLKVAGKSTVVNRDSYVKRGVLETDQAWGITTGPGPDKCEPGKYDTIAKEDVEDIAGVRVKLTRNETGCAFLIEYCVQPDPDNSYGCLQAWQPAIRVSDDPSQTGPDLPIIKCEESRSELGIDVCDECKIVTEVNPGWINYKVAGVWYKICGGYLDSRNYCCDPDTGICVP